MSDSSSSDSDEEGSVLISEPDLSDDDEAVVREFLYPNVRPKNENYVDQIVPNYSDAQFMEHFRVSRGVVQQLVRQYENSPDFHHQIGPYGKLSGEQKVLTFLWYCGHQTSSFRDVADRFDISLSTLGDIIERITLFLSRLSPLVIKWPTPEEMEESARVFRSKGMPGAVGAIDGTHVKVDKPADDPESYFNRKDFYSVQAQVVCDHRRKIVDLFVGYPGSVHDARAYRNSEIADRLSEKCGEYFILGDSAYPCLYNLLTPFKDRGDLSNRQRRFNAALSGCRVVVEHTIGLWKQKFRQLYHLKIRNMVLIVHFIRACAVLHNLAIDDEFVPLEDVVDPSNHPHRNLTSAQPEIPEDASAGVRRRYELLHSLHL